MIQIVNRSAFRRAEIIVRHADLRERYWLVIIFAEDLIMFEEELFERFRIFTDPYFFII